MCAKDKQTTSRGQSRGDAAEGRGLGRLLSEGDSERQPEGSPGCVRERSVPSSARSLTQRPTNKRFAGPPAPGPRQTRGLRGPERQQGAEAQGPGCAGLAGDAAGLSPRWDGGGRDAGTQGQPSPTSLATPQSLGRGPRDAILETRWRSPISCACPRSPGRRLGTWAALASGHLSLLGSAPPGRGGWARGLLPPGAASPTTIPPSVTSGMALGSQPPGQPSARPGQARPGRVLSALWGRAGGSASAGFSRSSRVGCPQPKPTRGPAPTPPLSNLVTSVFQTGQRDSDFRGV